MIRPLLTLSLIALVSGCATGTPAGQSGSSAAKVQGADEAITINCSGADAGWVFCYRSAKDVCGVSGYTILRRDGEPSAAAPSSEIRTMLVKCN